jgi:hypothetical protein
VPLNGKSLRAQQAGKIAGNDISGHVKQRPLSRAQSRCRQAGEISHVAPGALDRSETFGASARRRRVSDRQQRHTAFGACPRQGSNAIGAGAQNRLYPGQIERFSRLPLDLHQGFDKRLDVPGCQRGDQALRVFARPCD